VNGLAGSGGCKSSIGAPTRPGKSRGVKYMGCRDRDELLLFGVLAQRGAGINFFSLLVDRTLLYSTASTIDVQGRCREMVMINPALQRNGYASLAHSCGRLWVYG
jgi:hypothetical protein